MIFRARHFEWTFPRPTLVMGIVNVTPDSFYDGGKYADSAAAVAHALDMAAEGAEILDVGGDSSRPGALPVPEAVELSRVIPVIESLVTRTKVPISIDTTKPAVARAALAAGACMVNDVAAHRDRAELWRVVAEFGAGYLCMHAQGEPATMQAAPSYRDVVREVADFFSARLAMLEAAGIPAARVALDPGIGFGKTVEHNLQLLAALTAFAPLGRPLLVGVSRKSFIGQISGAKPNQRLPGSLACASMAVAAGVNLIRTHDVPETAQAVRLTEAVLSHTK